MLTFRWKYKKLKQTEADQSVVECLGHFHMTRSGFCMCQNGVRAKETEADIAKQVFL